MHASSTVHTPAAAQPANPWRCLLSCMARSPWPDVTFVWHILSSRDEYRAMVTVGLCLASMCLTADIMMSGALYLLSFSSFIVYIMALMVPGVCLRGELVAR